MPDLLMLLPEPPCILPLERSFPDQPHACLVGQTLPSSPLTTPLPVLGARSPPASALTTPFQPCLPFPLPSRSFPNHRCTPAPPPPFLSPPVPPLTTPAPQPYLPFSLPPLHPIPSPPFPFPSPASPDHPCTPDLEAESSLPFPLPCPYPDRCCAPAPVCPCGCHCRSSARLRAAVRRRLDPRRWHLSQPESRVGKGSRVRQAPRCLSPFSQATWAIKCTCLHKNRW